MNIVPGYRATSLLSSVRGGCGGLLYGLLLLLSCPALAQRAPEVIFVEDFERGMGANATGARGYNQPDTMSSYQGGYGKYTGSQLWIDGMHCNGIIMSKNNSAEPAWAHDDNIKCATGNKSYLNLRTLASGMGMLAGNMGDSGHLVSSYTECNAAGCQMTTSSDLTDLAGGSVQFQLMDPLTVKANRFYTFQLDAGAMNCGTVGSTPGSSPRFQFQLLNAQGTAQDIGTVIDPCVSDAASTVVAAPNYMMPDMQADKPYDPATPLRAVWAVRRSAGAAFKYTDTSLRLRMYNRRTARLGNDGGFDNIRLLDITPSLSKAFSPNLLSAGGGLVKLVFTVTNRSDLYAKPGWQFTDNLASGLTLADTTVGGTCSNPANAGGSRAQLTGAAGTANFTIGGSLPAGAVSCTVEVNLQVAASVSGRQVQNCASNISAASFIDGPDSGATGCATLTVGLQEPFPNCPAESFVTRGSELYTMSLSTGAFTQIGAGGGPYTDEGINAIGFRQNDGYLWGYYKGGADPADSARLVRIGRDGTAALPYPGRPVGVTYTGQFVAADIQPSSGYYVVANSTHLYFIDVTTNTSVRAQPSSAFGDSTDLAFNPVDGNIYAVARSTGEVFRVNPATGQRDPASLVTLPTNIGTGDWGAVFFDNAGTFYAYRSGVDGPPGLLYRVFNVSGTGGPMMYDLLVPNAATSRNLDGARCPAAPPPSLPPVIMLSKTTIGAAAGPFRFTLANVRGNTTGQATTIAPGAAVAVDADGSNIGVQGYTANVVGQDVTITEDAATLPAGWRVAATTACTAANGQAVGRLNGNVYTLPGNELTPSRVYQCVFVNEQSGVDVYVTKTNGAPSVVAGTTVDYTITVGNKGPAPAEGTVIRDPVNASLTCDATSVPVCSASGGAACPNPITNGALQSGTGVAVPALPANSELRLTVSCKVK